ncbi:FKBP-type peptidyl-prolyl cis-trans isomerase, partial [uncultured Micrococcus sp.]|uniref:FKBP-type peptidyl-prolyl cis-trans isomerase n=1 Tax=uncultured Micrococcus sp. TaxID=114051 RepID=UPI00345BB33B
MSFGQRDYDRTKPEIDFPGDTPPEELVVEDLIEGSGPAVERGSRVQVHYVGVAWSTGEEFDASWNLS